MTKFIWQRMQRQSFHVGIWLGVLLALLHVFTRVLPLITSNDVLFTPFTMWLGIDSFSVLNLLFYLLLPFLSSLAFADFLKRDITSGFLQQIKLSLPIRRYYRIIFWVTFISGACLIALPLLINLVASSLVLPSYLPDELLNNNIAMRANSTLFVGLYYSHPVLHQLFYLLLAAIFGGFGLFACFTLALSLWLKQPLVALFAAFLLQLLLYLLNSLLFMNTTITPFDFLPETVLLRSVQLSVVLSTALCLIVCSSLFYVIGVKRHVWL
ncbi:hypothetical protein [Brochothrix campestris]|uniref:Membrane-spanning protein n=1 Tax=Brochothrix campestris FSL F6-1037 TaxID=1265861 RepID=W7CFA8_9LIST|nr:hypothetical protein [Brochothrix campestris]EUJ38039.1 hypothetical protein BCAMP_09280 [Brochothrix campestris FSL F6-1037]